MIVNLVQQMGQMQTVMAANNMPIPESGLIGLDTQSAKDVNHNFS